MNTTSVALLGRLRRLVLGLLTAGLFSAGPASVTTLAQGSGVTSATVMTAPSLMNLGAQIAQNPDVAVEAAKLGLKAADGLAEGVAAIQDSKLYLPVDAGMGVVDNVSDGIKEALEKGKNIGDLLDKHKDKIKGLSDKIKVISAVLKGLKVAHLSGHVIEALHSGDHARFSESLNNAVKEGLKMGGEAAGALAGGAGGTKAGALIGAWFGGVGAVPGAIIGGAVGSWLGGKGGEFAAEWVNDNFVKESTGKLADWVFESAHGTSPPLLPPPLSGGSSASFGSGRKHSQPAHPPQLKAFR